jgi:predicted ATPase
MKINSLEFFRKSRKWELSHVSFDNLALLVGASGVGKTQILKSITDIKKIADGKSLNGFKWKIDFTLTNGSSYSWDGEFQNIQKINDEGILGIDESQTIESPAIIYEKVSSKDRVIIDRKNNEIYFNGIKTVKLAQEKSVINLLKEEEEISTIYKEISKIIFNDYSESQRNTFTHSDIEINSKKYQSLDSIRDSNLSLRSKLHLVYTQHIDLFNEIKETYIKIFSFVEDLKLGQIDLDVDTNNAPAFILKLDKFIKIKEHDVIDWIDERYMSSGMFRTLMQIAELYLCADGSVILIDEFENSLGINCLNEVANEIMENNRNLQFIITSHHPYIINNIPMKNWKIITRKAGVIKSYESKDLNLGKSKHEAFTQLINLDLYSDGAAA